MANLTRRDALKSVAALATGAVLPVRLAAQAMETRTSGRIPLVHLSDLYHPPQDPDDHLDLATIVALPEYDLRGVVLDVTRKFLVGKPAGWDVTRDPGYIPVAQLGYLTGRTIPAAMGPIDPLTHAGDKALDRPRAEQAGIELLLEVLKRSGEPVTISVVGSARVLAAACNREPELMKAKTRAVLLNAGATGGAKREWNVALDPAAYVALWRSGLPIRWFPCATEHGAFDPAAERGTFWKASHAELFHGLPAGLRAWVGYAFAGSPRGDVIAALAETGEGAAWVRVLGGQRNMWATLSLIMGANRVLARTANGWRFVPPAVSSGCEVWPMRLDPIEAAVDDAAQTSWRLAAAPATAWLFGRKPGAGYGIAMAEALNALLREISL